MKLRGHHLFCTALFVGHGYSKEFTGKMKELTAALRAGEEVTVKTGSDEICLSCPNRTGAGGCALGTEDAAARDAAAMNVLHLVPGAKTNWEQVKAKLLLITEQEFQFVCGDCRWQKDGICSLLLLKESLNGGK